MKKQYLPILAIIAVLAASSSAGAINLDSGMSEATNTVCQTIKGIQNSAFLTLIAMVMFIGGGVMMWLKMRGGMALAITGFVGYFLVKQSLAIAQAFKLLPKGCTA